MKNYEMKGLFIINGSTSTVCICLWLPGWSFCDFIVLVVHSLSYKVREVNSFVVHNHSSVRFMVSIKSRSWSCCDTPPSDSQSSFMLQCNTCVKSLHHKIFLFLSNMDQNICKSDCKWSLVQLLVLADVQLYVFKHFALY